MKTLYMHYILKESTSLILFCTDDPVYWCLVSLSDKKSHACGVC